MPLFVFTSSDSNGPLPYGCGGDEKDWTQFKALVDELRGIQTAQ